MQLCGFCLSLHKSSNAASLYLDEKIQEQKRNSEILTGIKKKI